LRPGSDGLVWFTQNCGAGRISPPSREVAEREGVPVRLACPACLLMPWRKVARTVGWTAEQIGAENQRAIDQGDNPNEWLAATQPLGLTQLTIQILTADRGGWPVELKDLMAKRYVMFALPLTNVLRAGPVVLPIDPVMTLDHQLAVDVAPVEPDVANKCGRNDRW